MIKGAKSNMAPENLMVGRRSFPFWGPVKFMGRTVKCQGCNSSPPKIMGERVVLGRVSNLREILQNCHTFALLDPPQMGNLMIPVSFREGMGRVHPVPSIRLHPLHLHPIFSASIIHQQQLTGFIVKASIRKKQQKHIEDVEMMKFSRPKSGWLIFDV